MERLAIKSKYFKVFYDQTDSDIIDRIVAEIDSTYDHVTDLFSLRKETTEFIVHLCADTQSFKQLTQKSDEEYEEWMVGNADYQRKVLCILSPKVVHDRDFESMMKVCRHEVVHIAFDQLGDPDQADLVISEGIAVALAEQIDPSILDPENCPLMKKLQEEEYFYNNNGYQYSGAYVLHLLKKCGSEVFKEIYSVPELLDRYLYDGFEKDAVCSLKQ